MAELNPSIKQMIDDLKGAIIQAYNRKLQDGTKPSQIRLTPEYASFIVTYFSEFQGYFGRNTPRVHGISDLVDKKMLLGKIRVTSVHEDEMEIL